MITKYAETQPSVRWGSHIPVEYWLYEFDVFGLDSSSKYEIISLGTMEREYSVIIIITYAQMLISLAGNKHCSLFTLVSVYRKSCVDLISSLANVVFLAFSRNNDVN